MPRPPALAAALVAVSLGAGCANAVNYLDPAKPFYEYHEARGDRAAARTGDAVARSGDAAARPDDAAARPDDAVARGDPGAARPDRTAAFRVVSFNIAYGVHVGRALDALRASDALRAPDALALQEMDAPGVERIARELQLNAVYFPSGVHPKHRRDFGCALLSPWPLEDPRKLVLPHAARGTKLRRSAVSAVVVRGGWRVKVYSVHLPSPLGVSGSSRRDEAAALITDADVAAAAGLPVIVAGDFNSHGIGELFTRRGYAWPTRDVGATARWALFGLHYDHVFTRGLAAVPDGAPAAGVVADNRDASDHKAIWVRLVPSPDAKGRVSPDGESHVPPEPRP